MDIAILLFVMFLFVQVFSILKTTRSAFYWMSKMCLVLEAILMGGINSIPIWWKTWKKMYNVETYALKKDLSVVVK